MQMNILYSGFLVQEVRETKGEEREQKSQCKIRLCVTFSNSACTTHTWVSCT